MKKKELLIAIAFILMGCNPAAEQDSEQLNKDIENNIDKMNRQIQLDNNEGHGESLIEGLKEIKI